MKLINKIAVFSIFTSMTCQALGGEVVSKVERVSAGGWALYYSIKSTTTYNPANCPNNSNYWFFDKNNEFGQAWLAIAMTAYTSGKEVSAYIAETNCLNGYPKLLRLTLGGAW